jgi:hypothetical protein
VNLGSPKLSKARESAVASIKASADQHAANVLPIIKETQKTGATTLRAVAEALNARGISTARRELARDVSQEHLGPPEGAQSLTRGRNAKMLVAGLWIAGTGVVALSFECVGAAAVLWGVAVLLIRFA